MAVFLIELALPVLLLVRRTGPYAIVVALGLHATFEAAAHPDVMGWVMGALLLSMLGRRSGGVPAAR